MQGRLKIKTVYFMLVMSCAFLAACASSTPAVNGKQVPHERDHNSPSQLGKLDLDRMADIEMRENTESLKLLMVKLYKRNPRELAKSTSGTAEEMADWVFEGGQNWTFKAIGGAQGTDALYLAFKPEYTGDRVLPFIVGLQTMFIKAHGGKTEFYFTDSIDPQKIYNAARNVEIAVWKLSNARDANGQLFLLTNEQNEHERNLSFEREFGKIIGRLDVYASVLAEKTQRFIVNITQGLATALFLPF
ncbi:MAG: hypothetical protein LBV44_06570 [Methylobacillus sp.]|nr:hypothetical protein [Methylobacillus sp.]